MMASPNLVPEILYVPHRLTTFSNQLYKAHCQTQGSIAVLALVMLS